MFWVDSKEPQTPGRPTTTDRTWQNKAEDSRKGGAPRGALVFELPKVVTRLRTRTAAQAAQRRLSMIVRMVMGWLGRWKLEKVGQGMRVVERRNLWDFVWGWFS